MKSGWRKVTTAQGTRGLPGEVIRPESYALAATLKRIVDPQGHINPSCLGLAADG